VEEPCRCVCDAPRGLRVSALRGDHTPKLPAADLAAAPVLGLIVISAALVAAGLASLRHRDLMLPA
jgi:putative exporter of polyketide antibiotics